MKSKIVYWIITVLIGLPFLFAGTMKAIGADDMMQQMSSMYDSPTFSHLLGIIELAGVAGLLFSRLRTLSMAMFLLIMAGATGSHTAGGQGFQAAQMPMVLSVLLIIGIYVEMRKQNWRVIPERR